MRYLIAKVFAACCALDASALGLLWNEMTTTTDQEEELLATWSHLSPLAAETKCPPPTALIATRAAGESEQLAGHSPTNLLADLVLHTQTYTTHKHQCQVLQKRQSIESRSRTRGVLLHT